MAWHNCTPPTSRRCDRSCSAPTRWNSRGGRPPKWPRPRPPAQLLTRLTENEAVLIGACNLLTAAVKANRRIAPAGEWLLDNFYLIEEQIRPGRRPLPKGDRRALPRLVSRPCA